MIKFVKRRQLLLTALMCMPLTAFAEVSKEVPKLASSSALSIDKVEITQGQLKTNGVRHVNALQTSEILASRPDVVVLDVRTAEEFAEERIDGAINIDFYAQDFSEKVSQLDPNTTYVLHCRSGVRSGRSVPILQSRGIRNLIHLDGGLRAWKGANNSVVQ